MNSKHYNVNQLRIDLWNELKEKSNRITTLPKKSENENAITDLNVLLHTAFISPFFTDRMNRLTNAEPGKE